MPVKWDYQSVRVEALKYSRKIDFKKNSCGAYQAALKHGWLDLVADHMIPGKRSWTNEELFEEALKYSRRIDFKTACQSAYARANNRGILDEVCAHMESPLKFWTKEEVHAEALKYGSRNHFKKGSHKAYQSARHNGWLEDVSTHMLPPVKGSRLTWTFEKVREEALKYQYREDFNRGSSGAHGAAKRYGWLDDVCGHMGSNLRSDHNVFYVWRVPHTDIYKIGVTSFRLGTQRILEVASKICVKPDVVIFKHSPNAVGLETSTLNITETVTGMGDFTGSSEFRRLTNQQLLEIRNIARVYL